MLWLLFLPFTLLFGAIAALVALPFALLALPFVIVLWLPFMLLRVALKVVLFPFVVLFAGLGLLIGAIAVVGALLIPLLPILFVAGCAWLLWTLLMQPSRTFR